MNAIMVSELEFSYGDAGVLCGVSFSVEEGSMCALLGKNGSGKTTLFGCMLGLLGGYSGSIMIDGAEAKSLSPQALSQRAAYVPQAHNPVFNYSALDMVLMGRANGIRVFGAPSKADVAKAETAMERMGIAELRDRGFLHLSGGERQLVLIARAIAQGANIFIMDEPTSGLDFGNRLLVMRTIRSLTNEGRTVLFSTHEPQQALDHADRLIALADGTAAAEGIPGEVLDSALIERLYGVHADIAAVSGRRVLLPPMTEL